MEKLFALLLVILLAAGCKESGQVDSPVQRETSFPVNLVRQSPPASLRAMFSSPARGPLTIAYTAPVGDNGKNVWLLLFERTVAAKDRPINTKFEGYTGSKGPITLLVVEANPSAPQKKWSLVREIPLGSVNKLKRDYVSLRWLEPAKKRGPVLFVNKLGNVGNSSGLIAFPNGWAQPNANEQVFSDWMNYTQGEKYDFNAVDENGFLSVTANTTDYRNDRGPDIPGVKYYDWNGSSWNNSLYPS